MAAGGVAPSATAKTGKRCPLLTRKEASDLIGQKVVNVKYHAKKSTDECTFKTKLPQGEDVPLTLRIGAAPLTPELQQNFNQGRANPDHSEINGLGDAAYVIPGVERVIAVSGDYLLAGDLQNLEKDDPKLERGSAQGAVRIAIARLDRLS